MAPRGYPMQQVDTPSGKVRGTTRLAYGFGLSAEGIKNNAFNLFLLFYYQQVVGLDPVLTGIALFIALAIDAVTDPAVGVWSDGIRSRLGRRHPFMYASSLPLAACYAAVFMPPDGMGEMGYFLWLLFFAVGTRFAMTLFVIPHQSLVAELTRDYDERTTLQSLRVVFAWVFGLINAVAGFVVFLRATPEYPHGLLNPAGYPRYAIFGAIVMLVATFVSSAGTQRDAVRLAPRTESLKQMKLRELPGQIKVAFESQAYRATIFTGLSIYVGFGVLENMTNYINTFFWGFTSEQIFVFILVIFVASMGVLVFAPRLAARYGKRQVGIVAGLLIGLGTPVTVSLKLLDVLPPNGSQQLLLIQCVAVFVTYSGIILGMALVGSMVADVTDEHELRTGKRQEGLLFSATAFLAKAASGVGVLGAGAVVKIAKLPVNARPDEVAPGVIQSLGVLALVIVASFAAGTAFFFSRYRLSRERHREIARDLVERRAQLAAAPSAGE